MASLLGIRRIRIWVAAAVALISSNLYAACRCMPPGDPKYELAQSAAVFSGRVVSIAKTSGMNQRVTFKVLKSWKGPRKKQLVLTNSTDPEECGMEFKKGQKYLVYALGDTKHLKASICTRTGPLEFADKDIAGFK